LAAKNKFSQLNLHDQATLGTAWTRSPALQPASPAILSPDFATMADAPFTIVQNLFKHPHPPIRVTPCHETNLSQDILQKFLDTVSDGVIGVSPAYGARSVLAVLAFASSKNVLLVHLSPRRSFKKGKHRKQTGSSQRDLLQELICANTQSKFAFRMDILATSLYLDLGIRITGAVDLLSSTTDNRQSLSAIMNVMGEADALSGKSNLAVLFKHDESATTPARNTALQAWAAWRAGLYTAEKHQEVPRIDTKTFEGTVRLLDFCRYAYTKQQLSVWPLSQRWSATRAVSSR
jgi:regulator of nonsense transcripts 1